MLHELLDVRCCGWRVGQALWRTGLGVSEQGQERLIMRCAVSVAAGWLTMFGGTTVPNGGCMALHNLRSQSVRLYRVPSCIQTGDTVWCIQLLAQLCVSWR